MYVVVVTLPVFLQTSVYVSMRPQRFTVTTLSLLMNVCGIGAVSFLLIDIPPERI
jgi:hypothetical protein